MKKVAGIFVITLILAGASQPAWAARTQWHVLAESEIYKEKMGGMIGRGLINAVTSPVDVLVNIVNDTKSGPPLIGTLTGIGKGVGCGVLRLGSGVVDVATFWVPGFNGFAVSDSYEDCMGGMSGSASIQPVEPIQTNIVFEPIEQPVDTIASTPAPIEVTAPKKWTK